MDKKQQFNLLMLAMVAGIHVPIRAERKEELAAMGGDKTAWFDALEVESVQKNELINTYNSDAGVTVDEIPFSFIDWDELTLRVYPYPGSSEEAEAYRQDLDAAKNMLITAGYAVGNWTVDDVFRNAKESNLQLPEDFTREDAWDLLDGVLDDEYNASHINDSIADALREVDGVVELEEAEEDEEE